MRDFAAKMFFKVFFGIAVCMLLTSAGYAAAPGMAYREEREAILNASDCKVPAGAHVHDIWLEATRMSGLVTTVTVSPEDYVRVALVCQAGTGYEWRLINSKLSFLEVVKEQVVPFPSDKKITGGKVAYIFLYKASKLAAGDDSLNFALYRQWEGVEKGAALVDIDIHYTTGEENKYKI